MELELVKVRLMKVPKMLGTKFSLRSKCKEIKTNRKITTQMQIRRKKTILKWKEISMEICTQSKSKQRMMKKTQLTKKMQINKWVRLTIKSESRI
jgi:hypothetical protein